MVNNVVLTGRITRDLELKYTQSNVPVVSFTVAVDRRFKNLNGEREADFINCVAFRNNAEFISKYFGKGRMIAIVGSIQTRRYTDKDGNNRTATEVVVDEVSFCGDKPKESNPHQSSAPTYATRTQRAPEPTMDDRMQQGFTDLDDEDGELPF